MPENKKLNSLIKKNRIKRINEFELRRYEDFFSISYKNNLEHSEANLESFPRWSIISGYYAMHDLTKLFIVRKSRIKINFKIHATTIQVLKELIKDKEVIGLIEKGYNNFLNLAQDLEEAKNERIKAQYYTGTSYMKQRYRKIAKEFHESTVVPYINKLKEMLE